jgi:hypothetical protein
MNETPFYKRPWFYVAGWLAFLLLVYGAQIYRMGGIQASMVAILFDLACILPLFFVIWMAFFAQFVLPVKTFRDRQKIFDRLRSHLFGSHGPALFIENGVIKEHSDERLKKGPGVVWLDSASAAVTRTAVAFKQTLGPGVHFTGANEYIEKTGTLDLHIQSQKLGPKHGENPFIEKDKNDDGTIGEKPSEEKVDEKTLRYKEIQSRRKQVSALSRDGIELVPDISISFRVNTGFPSAGSPGSRFGYRTGTTSIEKELERQDQDVICRALLGEGINPNMVSESPFYRVAWNRLPAMMAVDVWREYASKFILDEFFDPTQIVPPSLPVPPEPTDSEFSPFIQPMQTGANQKTDEGILVAIFRKLNEFMERIINTLEKVHAVKPQGSSAPPTSIPSNESIGPTNKTALQVINEMVKARLSQPYVVDLDEYGKRTGRQIKSEEYDLLQRRGLKVLSVSVSNIRLHPTIQEHKIKQWTSNWLKIAKDERAQLDLRRNLIETSAQEQAQCNYALRLSREVVSVCRNGKPKIEGLLMSVLLRSRAMIRSGEHSNSLRRRMNAELEEIEDMIKWMGDNS